MENLNSLNCPILESLAEFLNWLPKSWVLIAFIKTLDTFCNPGVTATTAAEELRVWKIEVILLKLNTLSALIIAWASGPEALKAGQVNNKSLNSYCTGLAPAASAPKAPLTLGLSKISIVRPPVPNWLISKSWPELKIPQ